MRRLAALALPAILVACSPAAKQGHDGGPERAPTASTSASVTMGGDGGAGPSREALLEVFLEAARTNLERPYPSEQPSSQQRYAEAAGPLLGREPGSLALGPGTAWLVASVLAQSDDDRAHEALLDWAAEPAAKPHLPSILSGMRGRPRDEWLATCRAILADRAAAGVIVGDLQINGGLLREALAMGVRASLQVMALELAAALPGSAGKELVREVAMNRAASTPDPSTLAALKCGEGESRVEAEAQALSSLRIMALSTLRDRALLAKVAADPGEPALVRHWVKRMREGGPDRSKPDWEKRLDARQKQAYEQSMLEFVPFAVAPCLTARPRPIIPSAEAPRGPGRAP